MREKKPRYFPMPISTLSYGTEYWIYDNEEAYIPSGLLHSTNQEQVKEVCDKLNQTTAE